MAKKSLESIVFPAEEFVKDIETKWSYGKRTVYNYVYKGIPLLLERRGRAREYFYVSVVTDEMTLPLDVYGKITGSCRCGYGHLWNNPIEDEDEARGLHDKLVKGLDEIIEKFGEYITPRGYKEGGRTMARLNHASSLYKMSHREVEAALDEKAKELEAKYPGYKFGFYTTWEECSWDGKMYRERSIEYRTPRLKDAFSERFSFRFDPDSAEDVGKIDYYISLLKAAKEELSTKKMELVKAEAVMAVEELKKTLLERA